MAGCDPDFGQTAASGQGVAYERVAAVVDSEAAEALQSQALAGGQEPTTQAVAAQGLAEGARLEATDERVFRSSPLSAAFFFPERLDDQQNNAKSEDEHFREDREEGRGCKH
ncbi:MAG: hypothetical protein HYR93_08310 [Chloroflexi bacterium]|nr:hypothetical protein [Chloroflexota bacterium]